VTYPTAVASFQNKVDLLDVIYASHVNLLQAEVRGTQLALGIGILTSVYSESPAVDWVNPTGAWTDLSARLANIERGLLNREASTSIGLPYFRKAGGALDDTTASVSLVTKSAVANTTIDQIQTKTSANVNGFTVDWNAVPRYQGYQLIDTRDETAIYEYIDGLFNNIVNINPLLISGM
jgi:hypothetical protein